MAQMFTLFSNENTAFLMSLLEACNYAKYETLGISQDYNSKLFAATITVRSVWLITKTYCLDRLLSWRGELTLLQRW